MVAEDALQQSMKGAVKRYSSLFKLPSGKRVIELLALLCTASGFASIMILFPSGASLFSAAFLGLALLCANLLVDLAVKQTVLKSNPIFDIRRVHALSLFCWIFWTFLALLGVAFGLVFGVVWWVRFCLFGLSAASTLRMIVFTSITNLTPLKLLAAAMVQPYVCVIPFFIVWGTLGIPVSLSVIGYLGLSFIVTTTSVYIYLSSVDRIGQKTVGLHALALLRAFTLDWIAGLNEPFEEFLEQIGEERSVQTSVIGFGSTNPKAVMLVPAIHPGPFRNIGSSPLPSLMKTHVESEFACVACVPHGVMGHEYDLASRKQNKKVIDEISKYLKSPNASEKLASPFIKVSNGLATACCQIFGSTALLSFTLAPKTIEDLPEGLDSFVQEQTQKIGLDSCVVVNAHNSINGNFDESVALTSLKDVAVKCLKKAIESSRNSFEIGAASMLPKSFSVEDGMGAGGVTVFLVKVLGEVAAYVVIDGNNMVSGLRETILGELRPLGVCDGEVFTTDTHSVSGLVLNRQGYHPIGESIDKEKLLAHIREIATKALGKLELSSSSYSNVTVSNVKVIGAKQLENLCLMIDKAFRRAKANLAPVFVTAGLVLTLFWLFT